MHPSNGTKAVTIGGLTFPFTIYGDNAEYATDGRHTYTWIDDRFVGDDIASGLKFLDPPPANKCEAYVGPNPPQVIAGTWQ